MFSEPPCGAVKVWQLGSDEKGGACAVHLDPFHQVLDDISIQKATWGIRKRLQIRMFFESWRLSSLIGWGKFENGEIAKSDFGVFMMNRS